MARSNFKSEFNLDTWATFSKKYKGKRCKEIFDIDPDYLCFCIDAMKLKVGKDLQEKIENFKKRKDKKGIKKVTCFK